MFLVYCYASETGEYSALNVTVWLRWVAVSLCHVGLRDLCSVLASETRGFV